MSDTAAAFDLATLSAERRRAIDAEQTHALYQSAMVGLVASLVAAGLLSALFFQEPGISHRTLKIWLAVMVCQTSLRLGLLALYRHLKPPPARRPAWRNLFTLGAAAGGLTWGIGAVAIIMQSNFETLLLLVMVISGLIYASLSGFGSYQPFYALLFCSFTPIVVWSAFQHDVRYWVYAGLGAVWLPAAAWLGLRHDRAVIASYSLRYQNLELMHDLQVQKERAEDANIAKSRFLASASHDLRQPVHALGMFVGALKAHEMGAPARRLLGHIEGSIGALDMLFASLLDISRLDAGVITASKVSFLLQPMLERICGELRGDAEAKGVRLTLAPTSLLVDSDPVLLERILRNIIANAVRYTPSGRILVGCRRGAALRVQIRDTGPGIPQSHQERVFEEFFQLGNLERDRSQGLGLGLAIVRRLTLLLGHPLRLESVEGRGTLFEIKVPEGVLTRMATPPVLPAPEPTSGLILVVDDELAVCEAMRSLLESWGHQVVTADSGRQMLQRMAQITRPPALIISDYRLRGENGIDVIRRLQSEFNDDIPAMLITGDTAPDRLAEARVSGFLLLHKPLSAERLRRAIHAVI